MWADDWGARFIPSRLRKSVPAVGWKIWIRSRGGDRSAEECQEGRRQWVCAVPVCVCSFMCQVGEYLVSHDCL